MRWRQPYRWCGFRPFSTTPHSHTHTRSQTSAHRGHEIYPPFPSRRRTYASNRTDCYSTMPTVPHLSSHTTARSCRSHTMQRHRVHTNTNERHQHTHYLLFSSAPFSPSAESRSHSLFNTRARLDDSVSRSSCPVQLRVPSLHSTQLVYYRAHRRRDPPPSMSRHRYHPSLIRHTDAIKRNNISIFRTVPRSW